MTLSDIRTVSSRECMQTYSRKFNRVGVMILIITLS